MPTSRKLRIWIIAAALAAAALLALLVPRMSGPSATTRYVAYIARYTNMAEKAPATGAKPGTFAMLHEIVLRDHLERLNRTLHGVRLELRPFDNRSNARVADSIYAAIAADTSIVMTVDNGWGVDLLPCAERIRREGLPVIAINADRNAGDFGASTIFTGNDDDVPYDLVAYMRDALGVKRANMVTETDYALDTTFRRALAGAGITIGHTFGVAAKAEGFTPDALFAEAEAFYRANPSETATPIIINTHNKLGDKVLAFLDGRYEGLTIVGGRYISSLAALQAFGRKSGNRLVVMGRANDALPKALRADLDQYRAAWPEYFASPSAPFFVKRCADAVEILSRASDTLSDRAGLTRATVRSALAALRGRKIAGADDVYAFDSNGVMTRDVDFAMYRRGEYYSMPEQMNRERKLIPNVFIGVDVQDMYDIDVNTNTFRADFFYWVKLDTAFRDAERNIVFQNIRPTESNKELVIEKMDGPMLYRLYKASAQFHNDYELRDYPLDEQEIAIKVEILDPADRLRISFDQRSLDDDTRIFERFKVRAWNKMNYFVTVDNRISSAMRGDPENREGELTTFKTFAFRLLVKRKFTGPFLEIILPLVLIGFVAIALLYVRDISFENLGEVSVGTFLGIITFSIALSNITPSSDYLTRADLLFWLTFMVVLVSFMTVIIVNSRYGIEELHGVNIRPIAYLVTVAYPLAAAGILLL